MLNILPADIPRIFWEFCASIQLCPLADPCGASRLCYSSVETIIEPAVAGTRILHTKFIGQLLSFSAFNMNPVIGTFFCRAFRNHWYVASFIDWKSLVCVLVTLLIADATRIPFVPNNELLLNDWAHLCSSDMDSSVIEMMDLPRECISITFIYLPKVGIFLQQVVCDSVVVHVVGKSTSCKCDWLKCVPYLNHLK